MNKDYSQDPAVSKSVVRRHLAQNPDNCPHCGVYLLSRFVDIEVHPVGIWIKKCPDCGKGWSV